MKRVMCQPGSNDKADFNQRLCKHRTIPYPEIGHTLLRSGVSEVSFPSTTSATSLRHQGQSKMSASKDSEAPPVTKKFGKGERTVPAAGQRVSKYYPAEDVPQSKKVCVSPCVGSRIEVVWQL